MMNSASGELFSCPNRPYACPFQAESHMLLSEHLKECPKELLRVYIAQKEAVLNQLKSEVRVREDEVINLKLALYGDPERDKPAQQVQEESLLLSKPGQSESDPTSKFFKSWSAKLISFTAHRPSPAEKDESTSATLDGLDAVVSSNFENEHKEANPAIIQSVHRAANDDLALSTELTCVTDQSNKEPVSSFAKLCKRKGEPERSRLYVFEIQLGWLLYGSHGARINPMAAGNVAYVLPPMLSGFGAFAEEGKNELSNLDLDNQRALDSVPLSDQYDVTLMAFGCDIDVF